MNSLPIADVLSQLPPQGWQVAKLPCPKALIQDPYAFMASQHSYPAALWQGRDCQAIWLAFGLACPPIASDQLAKALRQHPTQRCYGGTPFAATPPKDNGPWQDFPQVATWFFPRLEIQYDPPHTTAYVWVNRSDPADTARAINFWQDLQPEQPLAPWQGQCHTQHTTPNYADWAQAIATALATPSLDKVVLATQRTLQGQWHSPWDLFRTWAQQTPHGFHLALSWQPAAWFFACTPERLFLRQAQHLITEALAGSCPRGETPAQDAALTAALLADPKSQQENYWVEKDICAQLGNITHTQHIEPLHTITLPTVQHLKRTITGTLQSDITDADLIARLHPTPAVGGLPRSAALAFIANQEPFCRGYYAGAFGQLSHQHSEVCVSIRSAVFTPTTITLWTGAGILTGSDPATEWQELQDKSRHLLTLILGDTHA